MKTNAAKHIPHSYTLLPIHHALALLPPFTLTGLTLSTSCSLPPHFTDFSTHCEGGEQERQQQGVCMCVCLFVHVLRFGLFL